MPAKPTAAIANAIGLLSALRATAKDLDAQIATAQASIVADVMLHTKAADADGLRALDPAARTITAGPELFADHVGRSALVVVVADVVPELLEAQLSPGRWRQVTSRRLDTAMLGAATKIGLVDASVVEACRRSRTPFVKVSEITAAKAAA